MTDEKISGAEITLPKKKGKFLSFLDNFWYHNKWYLCILAVFVIFITVCVVQCAKTDTYDGYVVYAGNADVKKTRGGELVSPYEVAYASLKGLTPDVDGDGKNTLAFQTYYILTAEEAATKSDLNATRLYEDASGFADSLVVGDYYVFILSADAYDANKTSGGADVFTPLSPYATRAGLVYYDECAVLLSSTALGQSAYFCDMPEDTVVCLRSLSEVSRKVSAKKNQKAFAKAEAMMRNLLK